MSESVIVSDFWDSYRISVRDSLSFASLFSQEIANFLLNWKETCWPELNKVSWQQLFMLRILFLEPFAHRCTSKSFLKQISFEANLFWSKSLLKQHERSFNMLTVSWLQYYGPLATVVVDATHSLIRTMHSVTCHVCHVTFCHVSSVVVDVMYSLICTMRTHSFHPQFKTFT